MGEELLKILFVINQGSGADKNTEWQTLISNYFSGKPFTIIFFNLPGENAEDKLKALIQNEVPQRIVAVGGDGTVTMVAAQVMETEIIMGIIPAGSANGMARELQIPENIDLAIQIIIAGHTKKADVIKINNHICIHLSDVGLNAQLVKHFQEGPIRGKLGYARALFKALFNTQRMHLDINTQNETLNRSAIMVLIANASKYGSGATINPLGNIYDGLFEIVIVRKLGFSHIIKMFLKFQRFDPSQIEVIQSTSVKISTKAKAHFQVDGEYLGKTNLIEANILPATLNILIPSQQNTPQ